MPVARFLIIGLLVLPFPKWQEIEPTQFDDWYYIEVFDPITDEKSSFIATSLEEEKTLTGTPGVSVARMPTGMMVMFTMGDIYFMEETKRAVYRFDKNEPAEITARVSGNQYLVLPSDKTDDFIESAKACETLVIRVFGETTRTHSFSLKGFSAAYQKLTGIQGLI